ncbi:MAG TPA: hypothetical protein DCE56_42515, partial [Cyanobacteria bacterium UBA8553]|nr:hypothetical protein [Cyanobacteria bacterium UBA8553]
MSVDYYKIGGSLEYQHSTYVVRQADRELYEGLKNGEFCYVLNSRQMGKSSLRVQMMKKLKEQGIRCASIDMTRIGNHVSPAEWYGGVVSELLRGFSLLKKVDFSTWWRERELLPPLQRLRELIEDVLLVEFSQNLVIFIDEIDSIIKIKFKEDFFAFIRACYNQRVDNPEYNRLTFCLLGVATPSDLIADKNRTPFNIGRAIELTGFQYHEVQALIQGLEGRVSKPAVVFREMLEWTGGQPFLTQKLCKLLLYWENSIQAGREAKCIEELVRSHIIEDWEAQDEPEHLRTIRDRLLRNEQRTSRLLGIYQQILQSTIEDEELERSLNPKSIVLADDNPEQIELRLSGLVVRQQGQLIVSNQIYQSIFNQSWVENQLVNMRPYSKTFTAWLATNCDDESHLLQGQVLQEALAWSANKSLSVQDYQFLIASQELDKREAQIALEEAKKLLPIKEKLIQTLQQKLKLTRNHRLLKKEPEKKAGRSIYGSQAKKDTKCLLEALLAYANNELENCEHLQIQVNWQTENRLVVSTKVRFLEKLTAKSSAKLTKEQIKEALKRLEDFLGILEDNRTRTQGSEDRHFTLKLWHKRHDKEANLKQFDLEWERHREARFLYKEYKEVPEVPPALNCLLPTPQASDDALYLPDDIDALYLLELVDVPEVPEGSVALSSVFYVERPPIETHCYDTIIQPGALIRIKAPRQMGKTSLLDRIAEHANMQGYITLPLNLQEFGRGVFSNLDEFLRWFCEWIDRRIRGWGLRLPVQLSNYWDENRSSMINCTTYFETHLLEQINRPLVLALDNVDCVFQSPEIAQGFFSMLRSWHEEAKTIEVWEKLRLIVVHSTEDYGRLDL